MSERYFGEIESFPEGSMFTTRVELSKAGLHPPPVAGISGGEKEGAASIVLSGGYEDDLDFGNEILRSKREIDDLIKQIPDTRYSVSGYFDIGLKTKIVGMREIKGIYKKLKYLFFSSNHILVNVSYL